MARFEAVVAVWLKDGIANPEVVTIEKHLPSVGLANISQLDKGKIYSFFIEAENGDVAKEGIELACDKLLAGSVTERFEILRFVWADDVTNQSRGKTKEESEAEL